MGFGVSILVVAIYKAAARKHVQGDSDGAESTNSTTVVQETSDQSALYLGHVRTSHVQFDITIRINLEATTTKPSSVTVANEMKKTKTSSH